MNDAKQASPAFGGFLILPLKYDPEQAAAAFICKRPKLNDGKLSDEERKWLKRIAQKSDLLKNP